MLALFLFTSFSASAIDVGDGSDGVCTNATFVLGKRSYQCTSLTINAPLTLYKGVGGAALVIKVQNDVDITGAGSIDLSGNNGQDGNIVSVAFGGTGGAGGFSGGNSSTADPPANPPSSVTGGNGAGAGAGVGGQDAGLNAGAVSVGAGGGGGSYKTAGTAALLGDSNGTARAPGANGSLYGNEAAFETTFVGGSGGGAGGNGNDGTNTWFGSAGGGGGGALHIVAGGNILIDGTIISNGGNGGGAGTETSSGGGGGASGGAIWLQAAGTLTVSLTGSINATGGLKGTNVDAGFLGDGGSGGDGRIRLDAGNGSITNNGSVTPAPYTTSFTPTPINNGGTSAIASRQYSSSVSCARVSEDMNQSSLINVINLLVGISLVGAFHFIVSRRGNV